MLASGADAGHRLAAGRSRRVAAPRAADLIYSNAALHWLSDHAQLFPSLLAHLAPGGVLAVQMPRMFSEPSHQLVAEARGAGPGRPPWRRCCAPPPVAEPAFYYDLLARSPRRSTFGRRRTSTSSRGTTR